MTGFQESLRTEKSRFRWLSGTYHRLGPPPTQWQNQSESVWKERRWWIRLAPVFAIAITTSVSLAIGILRLKAFNSSTKLFNVVSNDRGTVQVVVQVISQLLGSISTLAVCLALNYHTRSLLARKRDLSLNSLRLWAGLSRAQIAANLPFSAQLGTLIFWVTTFVPSALWAGALTPQDCLQDRSNSLAVPLTGEGSYSFLQPRDPSKSIEIECWVTQQLNGTFTNCPTEHYADSLVSSASSATSPDGSARNHSKFDNTRFRYSGRSYGAGAPVGLVDSVALHEPNFLEYFYTENGYLTETNCIYNTSSLWTLSLNLTDAQSYYPNTFIAQGYFPNSNWSEIYASNEFGNYFSTGWDFYTQVAFNNGGGIVSMGSHNSDYTSRYFVALAAGHDYAQLNMIQCELLFHPTIFNISVSNTSSTITVVPTTSCLDPEPRGILRSRVMDSLNRLTMVVTSLYKSTVGEALLSNIQNFQIQLPHYSTIGSATPGDASNDTILAAVAESITAMADDILMSFAAAALTLPNATSYTTLKADIAAIQIGSTSYIIAILIINLTALLAIIGAAIYTRCWSQLPLFDHTDLACVSAGIAAGAARSQADLTRSTRVLAHWNGDPQDRVLGKMAVHLEMSPTSKQVSLSLR